MWYTDGRKFLWLYKRAGLQVQVQFTPRPEMRSIAPAKAMPLLRGMGTFTCTTPDHQLRPHLTPSLCNTTRGEAMAAVELAVAQYIALNDEEC